MKTKKLNVALLWKQVEDLVIPQLRLSLIDRVVYSHLLRHSRLEGHIRLRFSIIGVARQIRTSTRPVRNSVRHLVALGALRMIQRSKAGHMVDVRCPDEIPALRSNRFATRPSKAASLSLNLEETDFMRTKPLRDSIHARERGLCFYCLRRTVPKVKCLDHVVSQARAGRSTFRNLVSTCMDCNVQKGEHPADDFLRRLYRERRLTATELAARLRALDSLALGKLRPSLPDHK
jgi:5-methylcytosine-specific restriction endonuclease McrA